MGMVSWESAEKMRTTPHECQWNVNTVSHGKSVGNDVESMSDFSGNDVETLWYFNGNLDGIPV